MVDKLRMRTTRMLGSRRGATAARGLRRASPSRTRDRDPNKGATMVVSKRTPSDADVEAVELVNETAESERKVRAALERNRVLGRGLKVGK